MPSSARIYLRRRVAVAVATAVVLASAIYVPMTLLAPLDAVEARVIPFEASEATPPAIALPSYGASALGAVGHPGLLVQGGSTDALPIASISKVVTALVVLDARPLTADEPGPELTLDEVDVELYQNQVAQLGSVAPVHAGQTLTQRDVMATMLVVSANNYAESLARWAFGPPEAFAGAAATWLASHDLDHTTIEEPTGVSPNNTSTSADLIHLGELALADPVVSAIVATEVLNVPGLGDVHNSNKLVGTGGVDGIKTGTLDEAGSCLLFAQDFAVGSTTVTLVGVVLGGPDHATIDAAVRTMLTQADAGFTQVKVVSKGESFGSYRTAWGEMASAVATEDLSLVSWSGDEITGTVDLQPIERENTGSTIGYVEVRVDDRPRRVELALDTSISDPGPWWRLGNPSELF